MDEITLLSSYLVGIASSGSWSTIQNIFGEKITNLFREKKSPSELKTVITELLEKNPAYQEQVKELMPSETFNQTNNQGSTFGKVGDNANIHITQNFNQQNPGESPPKKP